MATAGVVDTVRFLGASKAQALHIAELAESDGVQLPFHRFCGQDVDDTQLLEKLELGVELKHCGLSDSALRKAVHQIGIVNVCEAESCAAGTEDSPVKIAYVLILQDVQFPLVFTSPAQLAEYLMADEFEASHTM